MRTSLVNSPYPEMPSGKYVIIDNLPFPQLAWLESKLNREGCLLWAVGGTIFLKDMPRAKRILAQALEMLPEPVELVLDPKWSDQE